MKKYVKDGRSVRERVASAMGGAWGEGDLTCAVEFPIFVSLCQKNGLVQIAVIPLCLNTDL